jgi:hypothetical protein
VAIYIFPVICDMDAFINNNQGSIWPFQKCANNKTMTEKIRRESVSEIKFQEYCTNYDSYTYIHANLPDTKMLKGRSERINKEEHEELMRKFSKFSRQRQNLDIPSAKKKIKLKLLDDEKYKSNKYYDFVDDADLVLINSNRNLMECIINNNERDIKYILDNMNALRNNSCYNDIYEQEYGNVIKCVHENIIIKNNDKNILLIIMQNENINKFKQLYLANYHHNYLIKDIMSIIFDIYYRLNIV